jgi:sugar/nucleoside kinase (ribokinase family)
VFRAALLYGLIQHWELLRTVRFASVAASFNCGAMGGWGGVPSLQIIESALLSFDFISAPCYKAVATE